jgi:hypothetical protein
MRNRLQRTIRANRKRFIRLRDQWQTVADSVGSRTHRRMPDFGNSATFARFRTLGTRKQGCVMGLTTFQDWRRECETVQKEMDRLITAGRPQSAEERLVRQLQFTALIERRDAAARQLLGTSPQADAKA